MHAESSAAQQPWRGREEPRGGCPGALSLLVFAGQAGGPVGRFRSTVQQARYGLRALTLLDTAIRTCEEALRFSSTLSCAPVLSSPVLASAA